MQQEENLSRSWYLVYTKPRQEQVALDHLERQSYQVYLPKISRCKRLRGRYQDIVEPLFPRYLFIALNTVDDNWAPIRSTLGVATIVRFGEYPANVPDELIAALKGGENEDGLYDPSLPSFEKGQRVRLLEGAMQGYEAIFQAESSKERVIILLEIAGRFARVQISQHAIERIQ